MFAFLIFVQHTPKEMGLVPPPCSQVNPSRTMANACSLLLSDRCLTLESAAFFDTTYMKRETRSQRLAWPGDTNMGCNRALRSDEALKATRDGSFLSRLRGVNRQATPPWMFFASFLVLCISFTPTAYAVHCLVIAFLTSSLFTAISTLSELQLLLLFFFFFVGGEASGNTILEYLVRM